MRESRLTLGRASASESRIEVSVWHCTHDYRNKHTAVAFTELLKLFVLYIQQPNLSDVSACLSQYLSASVYRANTLIHGHLGS